MRHSHTTLNLCSRLALVVGAAITLPGCNNVPHPAGQSAGNVLYRSIRAEPKTMDPSESTIMSILDMIYPSYYQFNYLKRNPYVIELALGDREAIVKPYPYNSVADGTLIKHVGEKWSFRVKPGIYFQDDPCFPGGKGREVVAADFLFSLRRAADPSFSQSDFITPYLETKVLGFKAYEDFNQKRSDKHLPADYTRAVEGFRVDPNDKYTFNILLNAPFPILKDLFAMRYTTPIAHEAVEKYGKEFARHPVGCGLYEVEEFARRQRIVLRKRKNHYPAFYPTEGEPADRAAGLLRDAGKSLPGTDKIVYNIIREEISDWNLFQQAYKDGWIVSQSTFKQAMSGPGQLSDAMRERHATINRDIRANIVSFMFNMKDPLVGGYAPEKRKLRQALSLAIDSQEIINLNNLGIGKPAQYVIPPGLPGYDERFINPYHGKNIARAKALLAEAGYTNGKDPSTGEPLTIAWDNDATDAAGRMYFALVKRQWEALGIHIVARTWRSSVLIDHIAKGDYQIAELLWIADYPDGEEFLQLFCSFNIGGPNRTRFSNPEFDKLYDRMASMPLGAERTAIMNRMREIVVEDCPMIYVKHDENQIISYPWLKNAKPMGLDIDNTKYLRIDGDERIAAQAKLNSPLLWPAIMLGGFGLTAATPIALAARAKSRRKLRRPGGAR